VKATTCPRCNRGHTGVCGIPSGVTRKYGARRANREETKHGATRHPRGRGKADMVVEQVLEEGRKQEAMITEALNSLMRIGVSEGVMPEFDG